MNDKIQVGAYNHQSFSAGIFSIVKNYEIERIESESSEDEKTVSAPVKVVNKLKKIETKQGLPSPAFKNQFSRVNLKFRTIYSFFEQEFKDQCLEIRNSNRKAVFDAQNALYEEERQLLSIRNEKIMRLSTELENKISELNERIRIENEEKRKQEEERLKAEREANSWKRQAQAISNDPGIYKPPSLADISDKLSGIYVSPFKREEPTEEKKPKSEKAWGKSKRE